MYSEEEEEEVDKKLEKGVVDEDADVDESDVVEDWDTEALAVSKHSKYHSCRLKSVLDDNPEIFFC